MEIRNPPRTYGRLRETNNFPTFTDYRSESGLESGELKVDLKRFLTSHSKKAPEPP